ncbi:MAG: Holliday junction resolvase RuvX [Candidatus Delongbacteria bacterium]|nr:Holliday junction resolvase RuvX [Candidatus Delongbacteria bacterium]
MRFLAIDYGRARTGVAVSDPTGLISRPLTTIAVRDISMLLSSIQDLCREYEIGTIIIGIPMRGNGTPGTLVPEIEQFIALMSEWGLPIHRVSEDFSSVRARELLHLHGRNVRKDKGIVDGYAAALILQEYLDEQL